MSKAKTNKCEQQPEVTVTPGLAAEASDKYKLGDRAFCVYYDKNAYYKIERVFVVAIGERVFSERQYRVITEMYSAPHKIDLIVSEDSLFATQEEAEAEKAQQELSDIEAAAQHLTGMLHQYTQLTTDVSEYAYNFKKKCETFGYSFKIQCFKNTEASGKEV